jgi:hypothetical protein
MRSDSGRDGSPRTRDHLPSHLHITNNALSPRLLSPIRPLQNYYYFSTKTHLWLSARTPAAGPSQATGSTREHHRLHNPYILFKFYLEDMDFLFCS